MQKLSAEQQARDMLERCGVDDAQTFSSGDLVELANLIADANGNRRQIAAIRRLHQQYRPAFGTADVCSHCTRGMDLVEWPCQTIQALDAR